MCKIFLIRYYSYDYLDYSSCQNPLDDSSIDFYDNDDPVLINDGLTTVVRSVSFASSVKFNY